MSSKAIATLVKIMESLPENMQDQVVEHLQEYIQKSGVIADTTTLEKVTSFDWDEWERRVAAANPDPDELTMEEICEIVREVHREKLLERGLQ
jgi:YD repeat-containing protein